MTDADRELWGFHCLVDDFELLVPHSVPDLHPHDDPVMERWGEDHRKR